jgi:hypothetical protein
MALWCAWRGLVARSLAVMKSRWLTIFLMLVAAGLATTKFVFDLAKAKQPGKIATVSCPDLPLSCRLELSGRPIEFGFSPAPVPLNPFMLKVKAPAARSVSAEFAMLNMDMGNNRYRLKPAGAGSWQANVTLPVCVTTRHSNWVMMLEVDGVKVRVPFTAGK